MFSKEILEALPTAFDKLAACEFLTPTRTKEQMFADVQVLEEWSETKGKEPNARKWVHHKVRVQNGNRSRRTGAMFSVILAKVEFYKNGTKAAEWYASDGCTGRFETLISMVSELVLRHDENFKDQSAIDIIL